MIPDKLRICGHEVNVRIERLDAWGEARPGQSEIVLADNISPDIQLQTLIHEILHFADAFYRIFDLDEEDRECQIQGLATTIYQVLVENKELTRALLKENSDSGGE